jgi:predicted P-loop ATPase
MGFDFEGLARELLRDARLLLPAWLPGGALHGHEYICGSLRGGPGRSLSVNINTGEWADFADDASRGGDLISLYAAINGIKQGDAFKELSDKVGRSMEKRPAEQGGVPDYKITAPPAGEECHDFTHAIFGKASKVWTYLSKDHSLLFYVARYDPPEGKKQYVPWSWDTLRSAWVKKSFPKPRPIYGLDQLFEHPEKPVLVVEGEKAADAARALTDAYVVVSWAGGASAWSYTDWNPLASRRLLLWPDADRLVADTPEKATRTGVNVGDTMPYAFQPGPKAMAGIASTIRVYASEVKLIDVGIDGDRLDGWDAADAASAGWTWADFLEWAKPRASIYGGDRGAVEADQIISPDAPPPEDPGEIEDKLPPGRKLYAEWERLGVATSSNGSPICNVDNALRVLEGRPEFKELVWYDEFHKRYLTEFDMYSWDNGKLREWSDVDCLNLTIFMQRHLGLRRMSDEMVHKACVSYAKRHLRNEPKDWFDGLTWDGVERCESFFSKYMGAAETEYVKAASRNFWISMVARIYVPGCQLDNMVILEGAQGIGKTRAMRAVGGDWYAAAKEVVTATDFFLVLHGKLIIEIAELDAFSKAETTRIKQVVSDPTDRYRSPYERGAQDHPRMCVFVGTTNESNYLRDNTGGRRFWPIKCGTILVDDIARDRQQLFAEAVSKFKAGESWHIMPVDETRKEQENRRAVDEWEHIVAEYLDEKTTVTTRDVAEHLKIDINKLDMILQKRVAGILRTLGWDKKTVRANGGRHIRIWHKIGAPIEVQLPIETTAEAEEPPF